MEFKEVLNQFLEDQGISQVEVAGFLGLSQQSVSEFLNSSSKPHRKTRDKYLKSIPGFEEYYKINRYKLDPDQTYEEHNAFFGKIRGGGQVREPDAHWYGVPNTMMVPMVSHRAQAGFLSGWADDTATLDDFPKIPWEVDREYKGKYVCFEVTGDSMDDGSREALLDGDVILCREVMHQHWKNRLHINQWDFVIAHKEKGIVVKRIVEHEVETGRLVLHSLNELYDDYEVHLQDCIALFNVVDVKRSRRR